MTWGLGLLAMQCNNVIYRKANYLIVLISLFSIYSSAQDDPGADNSEPAIENQEQVQEQVEEETTGASSPEQSSANRNFDVFQPSEDISEDLAVPFPVDI